MEINRGNQSARKLPNTVAQTMEEGSPVSGWEAGTTESVVRVINQWWTRLPAGDS
jgi:hypothetical protein